MFAQLFEKVETMFSKKRIAEEFSPNDDILKNGCQFQSDIDAAGGDASKAPRRFFGSLDELIAYNAGKIPAEKITAVFPKGVKSTAREK